MKANIGTLDRIFRIITALVIGTLYFTKTINGTGATALLVIGVILMLTSFIGFCPLYYPFKIKTNKN